MNDTIHTINDQIERLHLLLTGNANYREYLEAVWDEQAVEGSLACDNAKAAEMIREKAKETDNIAIAKLKLATIVKCLGTVLRRYGISRKERRHMVAGVIIPGNNGD